MMIRLFDRRVRRQLAGLMFTVLTMTVSPVIVFAEPSQEDIASAKSALKEGRELRAHGDLPGALLKLKAAYALVPTPITGYDVGKTQEMMGLLLEARETLLAVVNMPVSLKEIDEHKNARVNADELAQKIKARIPSLTLKLEGNVVEGTTKVTIDAHDVPLGALGAARKLNPGKHTVRATTGASQKLEEIELKEGDAKVITLFVPGGDASPPTGTGAAGPAGPNLPNVPPPAVGPSEVPTSDSPSTALRTVGLVVAGAGVVAIGAGAFLGMSAKSKYNESASLCRGNLCDAEGVAIREDARSKASVATVVFGIGTAALVGGVVLFIVAPSKTSTVKVGILPGMVNFTGSF